MKSKPLHALLPGEELVQRGLADLGQGRITECSLLVMVASPRLKRLGIPIPHVTFPRPYEHELYSLLEERLGAAAHSYYNSLIRRIVSYTHALELEQNRAAAELTHNNR